MKKLIYIPALVAILTATNAAHAQTYTKDVDVTVELQPEVRAASRLDVSPRTLTKSFPTSSLQYNGNAITMPVTPMISILHPVEGSPIYSATDNDGYLVAGYFPGADFGVSAGYRLVNSASTRLNAWTQLNRNSYKGYMTRDEVPDERRARVSTTDFDFGLNFSHASRRGVLSAATSLYLSHFNYPASVLDPSTQDVTRYRLSAGWRSTLDDAASGYAITADMDYFGYGKACFPAAFDHGAIAGVKPLHEFSGGVNASGQFMFNDIFGMGIRVGYRNASLNNRYLYMPGLGEFHPAGRLNRGVLSVGASFRFNSSKFSGHVGPQVDFGTGDGGSTHMGAKGMLNWNLSPYMLMFTTVETGTQLNTLGVLYDRSRYAAPLSAASSSFLEGDIKYGLSVGPFRGFSFTAQGGFSSASDWVMPTLADGVSTFSSTYLMTVYYSLSLGYEHGTCFLATATLEGAVSDRLRHAYYKWVDRAKQVLDVTVKWRPVDELTLEGGYELRLGRKICNITSMRDDMGLPLFVDYEFESLGRISSGRVGATYSFDETFGIFGRIEGIGQGRYLQASAMPGQRLRGLVGVTLSF